MPRYVIERTFPAPFTLPLTADGDRTCRAVDGRNAEDGVHWLHSYFSDDRTRSFCVYDAPTPEAVRRSAAANGLPVDRITEVRVLDPYFYRP
jgi:hypothetical protein